MTSRIFTTSSPFIIIFMKSSTVGHHQGLPSCQSLCRQKDWEGDVLGSSGPRPPLTPLFTIWLCPRTSGSAVPFDLYSICLLLCIILYCHVVIHTVDPNTFTLSTQHIPSPRCVCRPLSCWEIRWTIVSALLSTCIN